jgi:hypothetical protein
MTLKISNLEQYHSDVKRYQQAIDKLTDPQDRLQYQSLLRDYKNQVHKIDTALENIFYEDVKRAMSQQRHSSLIIKEIRLKLESISD